MGPLRSPGQAPLGVAVLGEYRDISQGAGLQFGDWAVSYSASVRPPTSASFIWQTSCVCACADCVKGTVGHTIRPSSGPGFVAVAGEGVDRQAQRRAGGAWRLVADRRVAKMWSVRMHRRCSAAMTGVPVSADFGNRVRHQPAGQLVLAVGQRKTAMSRSV